MKLTYETPKDAFGRPMYYWLATTDDEEFAGRGDDPLVALVQLVGVMEEGK